MMDQILLIGKIDKCVESIKDVNIRNFIHECLKNAPQKFFDGAASFSHHLFDEREQFGLLLHTIRVIKVAEDLCTVCNIGGIEKDIIIASAILHDLCKYGIEGEKEKTCREHPELFYNFVLEKEIPANMSRWKVIDAIYSHMGIFGTENNKFLPDGINPKSILVLADYIASQEDIKVDI